MRSYFNCVFQSILRGGTQFSFLPYLYFFGLLCCSIIPLSFVGENRKFVKFVNDITHLQVNYLLLFIYFCLNNNFNVSEQSELSRKKKWDIDAHKKKFAWTTSKIIHSVHLSVISCHNSQHFCY
jgi:hypothetical protein